MRLLLVVPLVAACIDRGSDNDPEPIDVTAAWQVRCPGCNYEPHTFDGPVAQVFDDLYVSCDLVQDILQFEVGRVTIAGTPTEPGVPGWGLSAYLGFDGTTFDLDRQCQISVSEPDERTWNDRCSDSPATNCVLTNPVMNGVALSFSLRCESMSPLVQPAGTRADVASPSSPTAAIDVRVATCRLTP